MSRVLFVGAHADDVELFAGGLLAKLARTGSALKTLTFSSHRGVTDHVAAAKEHRANIASLGPTASCTLLDLGACTTGATGFQAKRGLVYAEIDNAVRTFDPDLVVTHLPSDTNQDHQQVADEVNRACKGLTSIVYGEYPLNDLGTFQPQMFVELTRDDVDRKIQLIRGYESQYAPHRKYFDPDVWFGLAKVRGAQIGVDYAEAFQVGRMKWAG